MWICKNDAFLSIVDKEKTKNGTEDPRISLCVRARVKGHIESVFPDAEVVHTPHNDYHYRAFILRREVADAIHDSIMDIGYPNFKNSVADDDLHCAYADVWATMFSYGQAKIQKLKGSLGRERRFLGYSPQDDFPDIWKK
jgi:hypothetical protein